MAHLVQHLVLPSSQQDGLGKPTKAGHKSNSRPLRLQAIFRAIYYSTSGQGVCTQPSRPAAVDAPLLLCDFVHYAVLYVPPFNIHHPTGPRSPCFKLNLPWNLIFPLQVKEERFQSLHAGPVSLNKHCLICMFHFESRSWASLAVSEKMSFLLLGNLCQLPSLSAAPCAQPDA